MADLKQITEIDLKLAEQLAAVNVTLTDILKAQDGTNEHLKTLNGKVVDHEKRLNDYGLFKSSVENSAKRKAQIAAGALSWFVSILGTLATLAIIYLIYHYFKINLSNPN